MPPDALYRAGFLESLTRHVIAAAPPDEGKSFGWFLGKVLNVASVGIVILVGLAFLSMAGRQLRESATVPAGLVLAGTVLSCRRGFGSAEWQRQLAVLFHHPFSDAQKHRWFWRKEAPCRYAAGLLAAVTGWVWFAHAEGAPGVPPICLALAGAGAWANAAAVFALGRYLPISSRAAVPAGLVAAACFSEHLSLLHPLNPVFLPLLAVTSANPATVWGCAAGAVLFPLAVQVLISCRSREIAARLTVPAVEPVYLEAEAAPPNGGAPGSREGLMDRTRTPRERVLAECCVSPGAVPLGRWAVRRFVLAAAALLIGLAIVPVLQHFGIAANDDDQVRIALPIFCVLAITARSCFTDEGSDGFPFTRLTTPHLMPDGQSVVPAALLPVRMGTVWFLWLKSLGPRLLVLTVLLAMAAGVSGWQVQGMSTGLRMTAAAFIHSPVWLCAALMVSAWKLLTSGTVWSRHSIRWGLLKLSEILGFGGLMITFFVTIDNLIDAALADSPGEFAARIAPLCAPMILSAILSAALCRFALPDFWKR